jgi:hypothetical protein
MVTVPPKMVDPFYASPEWRAFVERGKIVRFGAVANARREDKQCRTTDCVCVFGEHVEGIRFGAARLDPRNVLFRASRHTQVTATPAHVARGRGLIPSRRLPL